MDSKDQAIKVLEEKLSKIAAFLKEASDQTNQLGFYDEQKEKKRILFELVKEQLRDEDFNNTTR